MALSQRFCQYDDIINLAKLDDTVADGNGVGGYVAEMVSGGGAIKLLINDSTASNSPGFGVKSNGTSTTIVLNGVTVTNNNVGLTTLNSGVLASYSNNSVTGNGTDGAPTTTVAPK